MTQNTLATSTTDTATPLRVAVIIGSNREGRFGPTVADWLLSRLGERADFEVDVVDLAESRLPTALSFDPSPEWSPNWRRSPRSWPPPTPSSSSPPSTTTPTPRR